MEEEESTGKMICEEMSGGEMEEACKVVVVRRGMEGVGMEEEGSEGNVSSEKMPGDETEEETVTGMVIHFDMDTVRLRNGARLRQKMP